MEQTTILGKKQKQDNILSDFEPSESDYIIRKAADSLKDALDHEVEEEITHDGKRLKSVNVKAKDGSVEGRISHIPLDPFGEKHAEIRTVLNIKPHGKHKHKALEETIHGMEFEVSVNT